MCHCLLIETEAGLVLVDTGFGERDLADPARLGMLFLRVARPALDPFESAARQVEALGFSRDDVRHIIPTHLDIDHAGGIADFRKATVHLRAAEHDALMTTPTRLDRRRYALSQRDRSIAYRRYEEKGSGWLGFEGVHELEGLPPEILLVPLPGHTRGHSGVAVQAESGWILHAGDAYFSHSEIHGARSSCPIGWRLFQWMLEADRSARLDNQRRLRALRRTRPELTVICSHDASEFDAVRSAASAATAPVCGAEPSDAGARVHSARVSPASLLPFGDRLRQSGRAFLRGLGPLTAPFPGSA